MEILPTAKYIKSKYILGLGRWPMDESMDLMSLSWIKFYQEVHLIFFFS